MTNVFESELDNFNLVYLDEVWYFHSMKSPIKSTSNSPWTNSVSINYMPNIISVHLVPLTLKILATLLVLNSYMLTPQRLPLFLLGLLPPVLKKYKNSQNFPTITPDTSRTLNTLLHPSPISSPITIPSSGHHSTKNHLTN